MGGQYAAQQPAQRLIRYEKGLFVCLEDSHTIDTGATQPGPSPAAPPRPALSTSPHRPGHIISFLAAIEHFTHSII